MKLILTLITSSLLFCPKSQVDVRSDSLNKNMPRSVYSDNGDSSVTFRPRVNNNPPGLTLNEALHDPLFRELVEAYQARATQLETDLSLRLKLKDEQFKTRALRYENDIRALADHNTEWQCVSLLSLMANCGFFVLVNIFKMDAEKYKTIAEERKNNSETQKFEIILNPTAKDFKLLSNKYIKAIKVNRN